MPLKTITLCSNYSVRVTRMNSTHTLSIYTLCPWTSKAGTSGRIDRGVMNLRSTGLFVFFFTLVFGCAARRHKTCIMYSHFKLSRPVIRHQSILANSDSPSFLIHLALFLSTERYTSDRIKFMSSFGSSVSHWLQIVFIPLVPSL